MLKPYIRRPHAVGKSYYPTEVASLYRFPKVPNPIDQGIAIGELGGGYVLSDINNYMSSLGLPLPIIQDVSVRGARNSPGSDADMEVKLDILVAASVYSQGTGRPAKLYLIFAPNDGNGMPDAVDVSVTFKPASFSWSWGGPEDQWGNVSKMEASLRAASNAGIVITAAAGDNGAGDGEQGNHCDYPASSQYVVACGGTSLVSLANETVWNDGSQGGSTGGGISALFAPPSWQRPVLPSGTGGRGVPDLAGNADPQTGYNLGQGQIIGGTSAVAPLMAALFAIYKAAGVNVTLPALYAAQAAFRDITVGNNNGFPAGPGYDFDTGMGVPIGDKLMAALQGGIIINPPGPGPTIGLPQVLSTVDQTLLTLEQSAQHMGWPFSNIAVRELKLADNQLHSSLTKLYGG